MLTVTVDGKTTQIAQSKAIERYIARKTGLMGASDEEAALVDGVCECLIDITVRYTAVKEKDAAAKDGFFTFLETQLGCVEKFVTASGAGFTVGASLSAADVRLYTLSTLWAAKIADEADRARAVAALAACQGVSGVIARVGALDGIVKHEAGRAARNETF